MKLTPRRIAAGISVAAAAVLLPAAALASSTGAAAPAHPAAPYCTSAHTQVWYALPGDAAAGSSYYQLEFTNVGHTVCQFYGYPGISAVNSSGGQVGKPATHSGGRVLVVLAPGATAHVVLRVTDAGIVCSNPKKASALKIYAPEQTAFHILGFPSEGCPGMSVMHVDSIHAGAGVPGYTIR